MSETPWRSKRGHDNLSPAQRTVVDEFYWHRPMLQIHESKYTNGPQISIMTYNLLSPCDEKRYPIPKFTRETIYFHEIIRYNPDIVCLQEVTEHHRFTEMLASYGYIMRSVHPNKYHAIAIAYKWELFQEFDHQSVFFSPDCVSDESGANAPIPGVSSFHGALFLCLRFRPELLFGHRAPSRDAIIVGTTHLPSKPAMAFHRTHFAATLLRSAEKFADSIRALCHTPYKFYTFITGDFNSNVDDPVYHSLVSKPVSFPKWAHDMLSRSINNPKHPEDEYARKSDYSAKLSDASAKITKLEDLHDSIKKRATSLYSAGYSLVHKSNCQPGTNEPWFSMWGQHSHQLVDYIFVISDWMGDKVTGSDSLDQLAENSEIKLLALLGMPTHEDMGSEDVPQPVVGEFPSDHMCMMADLELL